MGLGAAESELVEDQPAVGLQGAASSPEEEWQQAEEKQGWPRVGWG